MNITVCKRNDNDIIYPYHFCYKKVLLGFLACFTADGKGKGEKEKERMRRRKREGVPVQGCALIVVNGAIVVRDRLDAPG